MKNINFSIIFLMFSVVFIFVGVSCFFQKKKKCPDITDRNVQALVRQTARWTVASQQDTSPMIALLHANYAAGYLQALELIATEQKINQFIPLHELRKKVYGTQDKAARQMVASCPYYLGKNIDKELALMGIGV